MSGKGEECMQEDNIANINDTLKQMMKLQAEERLERRESEKRLIAALEKVADQGARIDHLETHTERNVNDMENLFNRVRDVELTLASNSPATRKAQEDAIYKLTRQMTTFTESLEKVHTFIKSITSKRAKYCYAALIIMIAVGTIMDVLYHMETLKKMSEPLKFILKIAV